MTGKTQRIYFMTPEFSHLKTACQLLNEAHKKNQSRFLTLALLYVLFCLTGCSEKKAPEKNPINSYTNIQYAKGFDIKYAADGSIEVTVKKPYPGAKEPLVYLLVPDSVHPPENPHTAIIPIPVKRIVCTSTTHIPLLDYLDQTNALVGFPGLDYISSPAMRKRIQKKEVTELGVDKNMDLERLITLKPDMVMAYLVAADFGQFRKVEELGIPVVINAEYLEPHPLGRAEWIKFMALFFGLRHKADSVFRHIESEYVVTRQLAMGASSRPVVMSGIMYRDTWFAPGGKNHGARLLADAGCTYVWEENDSEEILELSYEAMLEKAHQSDLWIGTGSFQSLEEMAKADARYTRFKPFVTKQVYTYNARIGPTGGSEYLELGYLRPDIILKDLVKIAHPELMPGYTLYFHARLK